MNDQQKATAKAMRNEGKSYRAIANALGLSLKTVYMCLNEMDWSDYYDRARQAIANRRTRKKAMLARKHVLADDVANATAGADRLEKQALLLLSQTDSGSVTATQIQREANAIRKVIRDVRVRKL